MSAHPHIKRHTDCWWMAQTLGEKKWVNNYNRQSCVESADARPCERINQRYAFFGRKNESLLRMTSLFPAHLFFFGKWILTRNTRRPYNVIGKNMSTCLLLRREGISFDSQMFSRLAKRGEIFWQDDEMRRSESKKSGCARYFAKLRSAFGKTTRFQTKDDHYPVKTGYTAGLFEKIPANARKKIPDEQRKCRLR